MSASKRLLLILALAAITAPAWAQRAAVWTASVTSVDTLHGRVYIQYFKDGTPYQRPVSYSAPPNGQAGVRVIVRNEIKRLEIRDAQEQASTPIAVGPVTPAPDDTPPPPPPGPTAEELAQREFVAKVERLKRLRLVLPTNDVDLRALEAAVQTDIKAHPEWEAAIEVN